MKTALRLLVGVILLVSCVGESEEGYSLGGWNKPQWIGDAVRAIASGRYPQVKAISYWHERWHDKEGGLSDLRLNSSEAAAQAYRDATKNPAFVTQPEFSIVGGMWKFEPPIKGIYLAAFPGFGATEDQVSANSLNEFEAIAGHSVAWAYFSDNWYDDIKFPSVNVAKIRAMGRTPFIRMMMRSIDEGLPDSKYSLQQFIDGKYDKDLKKWAQDAKLTGLPMLVEFGTEVNGDWFPWNGRWNGGGEDGPARFIAVYRRIVDIFRKEEAFNVSWAFHVNAISRPDAPWNQASSYWPGAGYVDWVGISVYGPQKANDSAGPSFQSLLDRIYPEVVKMAPDKPVAILEWGITEP